MGSPLTEAGRLEDETRHKVSITKGFWLGKYEVTQRQWASVMRGNPSKFKEPDRPVETVSWHDCDTFVRRVDVALKDMVVRLPTEAEWEYAARGGNSADGQPYAGCDRNHLPEYAWFCVNSEGHTHPVGRLKSNAMGLHDMSGNVAEWCTDWMAPYTEAALSDPRGPREGDSRVLRGGHYNSTSPGCAVFDRGWYVPTGKTEYYGLRVVMEPDEAGDEEWAGEQLESKGPLPEALEKSIDAPRGAKRQRQ